MQVKLTKTVQRLTAATGLALVAATFVAPAVCSASGTQQTFTNASSSAYAINVYSDPNCKGTRYIVQPGHGHLGHSTKVNAYSDVYYNGTKYASMGPRNACSTGYGSATDIWKIKAYPND